MIIVLISSETNNTDVLLQSTMEEKIVCALEVQRELSGLAESTADSKLRTAYQRIEKRLKTEIQFLQKTPNKRTNKESSNLPYLYGVFEAVKQSQGVLQVICDRRQYKIIIDVVCDNGKTWKKIIARNPQSLHLIWASDGQYGDKDAVKKVVKYVDAAKQESDFSPPRVVCIFTRGVTGEMADYLTNLGVDVQGERVGVSADTLRRLEGVFGDSSASEEESEDLESEEEEFDDESGAAAGDAADSDQSQLDREILAIPIDEKVLLDVTSMVVYISDVCNGGETFNFKDTTMAEQAEQEKITPTKAYISKYMENRRLLTSETALSNFKNFIDLLGGEKEKERALELIERITIVPDRVSRRFQTLKEGSKVRPVLLNNCLTVNQGFV